MLYNKTVAVVVPAYNEETQIGMVIETMPEFVDRIVIINDCSQDKTAEVVRSYFNGKYDPECPCPADVPRPERTTFSIYEEADRLVQEKRKEEELFYPETTIEQRIPYKSRIVLINHKENSGKGAGIITGYKYCRDHHFDCVGSMDGDGQMDPAELEMLCTPVVRDNIDYVKGNRLIHPAAWIAIPRIRCIGNAILSILTKVAPGYWHVSDTQTGYAVISKRALEQIEIHKIYRSYGYPNDVLCKLNVANCTLQEKEIKPVYHVGEKSKMKISRVIRKLSLLLLKLFFCRIWKKYLIRSFHPLFLLYHLAFILLLVGIPYGIKTGYAILTGSDIGILPVLAFSFLFTMGLHSMLFAMWMDMYDNEHLNK